MRSLVPFLLAIAAPVIAAPPPATAPARPKLIVAISVDQFSADLFARYRATFTGGLRRLAGGVVFPAGYQSHAATETCPGHSTILTGSRPARTGIIANNWFDLSAARPDKQIYCAEDEGVAGSTSVKYEPSPLHLRVPTLGDRMKRADPAARVVAVAGKDRAAIMMGGRATDQIWFWEGSAFRTLADHPGPVPAAVTAANARAAALVAKEERQDLPAACATMVRPVAAGQTVVGTDRVRAAGDIAGFRASPAFDRAIADLAIAMLDKDRLGRGPATDLLIVGLSATDYVGHGFGPGGPEMCGQMAALDATIGRLIAALDRARMPYAVVLTADHGGHDLPERSDMQALGRSVRVDPALAPLAVDKAIRQQFGIDRQIVFGDAGLGDIYIARDLSPAVRPRIVAAVRARYSADPQVAAVLTRDDLLRAPMPTGPVDEWSLTERARASFDVDRSGDLVVMVRPDVVTVASPRKGLVSTHGTPWDYDRRVPILFWRSGGAGFEQPSPIETVDIMPTLAALIGLPVPAAEIDGRCLDLDPGPDFDLSMTEPSLSKKF